MNGLPVPHGHAPTSPADTAGEPQMDAPLSIVTPQSPRAERPSGRPSEAASSGSGEFARMLTALAPGEAVPPDGAVDDDPLVCGEVPGVAGTGPTEAPGTAALPGSALLRRGLIAAGRVSEQGAATMSASAPDALPEVEAALATEEASAPVLPAADDAAASSTSLMQWMLQMVPPAPPAQPSGTGSLAGSLGSGRQAGDALSASGSAGKVTALETRARGVNASMSQADRLSDTAAAAADISAARKSEAAAVAVPASAGGGVVASVFAERARASASMPESDRGVSADLTASTAQAAMAAATAAAAATVTTSGSPVVAPAQTWIQTPVTQPGFSDEVVVELVRRVGQAEQGTHEVMLHLNPAEMGPVSVSIELNGTTARVEFSASEALTRHHLEAALPGLAEALRDDGLSLQHGAVHEQRPDALSADAGLSGGSAGGGTDPRSRGEPSFDGRSGFGDRAPRQPAPMYTSAGPTATESRPLASIGPGPGRIGRLDLFA